MLNTQPPDRLYHATPLYRYDPGATDVHGAWSVAKHGSIKGNGLLPRSDSSISDPAVYLASQPGVAESYASGNFGEEESVDWVILEIDASQLDPTLFVADLDLEAQTAAEDFFAAGFSEVDLHSGLIPWQVAMEATGQVKYRGVIPDALISFYRLLRPS